MKKIITLLTIILMTFCLCSCKKEYEESIIELHIISPTGAPSIAFYDYYNNSNFETNSVPKNIISFMTDNSDYDIVVIDTVSGIKAINSGAKYKIAATITFGNFYIAATGNDDNDTMDVGDKIVIFGKGQTPDLLFHYLYGNIYDDNIEYVSAATDAASCLASGKNISTSNSVDYVFIAEPALTSCLNNTNAPTYGKSKIYQNIQTLYKEKNNKDVIQASIFVKEDLSKDVINKFLSDIKKDINDLINDPTILKTTLGNLSEDEISLKYGVKEAPIEACLKNNNSIGLGYKSSIEIKDEIDNFISLFSLEETNEEIYFK